MKIAAFLQNQWFKDPERMKQILATRFKGDREEFIRTFLFWSCLTGKRLVNAFGEELCDRIVWQESSEEMGGHSASAFPANPLHIRSVLDLHQPDVVIAFGRVAAGGVLAATEMLGGTAQGFTLLTAPHPAARGAEVVPALAALAEKVRGIVAAGEVVSR